MHWWLKWHKGVPREHVRQARLLHVWYRLWGKAPRWLVGALRWGLSCLRHWTSWKSWDVIVIVQGVNAALRLIKVLFVFLVLVKRTFGAVCFTAPASESPLDGVCRSAEPLLVLHVT